MFRAVDSPLFGVLINRREVEGRRHFDLAHELFHILTWDAMPPEHVEAATEAGGNRVEQLANSFASALLMPMDTLEGQRDISSIVDQRILAATLNEGAEALGVTASAFRWRLAAVGYLIQKDARAIPDAALRNNGRRGVAEGDPPPLFSRPFMEVLGLALDQGTVSVRRAAGLLDVTVEDLADLFTAHGVTPPFEP